jgi:hypothetical protein
LEKCGRDNKHAFPWAGLSSGNPSLEPISE